MSTLVDDFLSAKDVLSKAPVCDYDTYDEDGTQHVNANPVCLLHGGIPTGPYNWSWCDKVDPQIPLLREALKALCAHLHLELVPDRQYR